MSMQRISDEMHSDTIAIRQKKYDLKSVKCIHTPECSRQSTELKRPDPFNINQIYL